MLTPIDLGHFLRQFGQSDRREIDAFNKDPNVTHSLALMNGDLVRRVLAADSSLAQQLSAFPLGPERWRAIYRAVLVRTPNAQEIALCQQALADSPSPQPDLIWALINTPEFLFLQ